MLSDLLDRFSQSAGVSHRQAQLILFIFIVSFIARAGILYHGLSIDDYSVSFGSISAAYPTFFSQGRFLHAGIVGAIDAMGVNVADVHIAFGVLALLLQATFVVSILRLVGVDELPGSGLVGAFIALHPYGTEVLTFRMALPGYCAAMLLSIVVLELVIRRPSQLPARLWAFLALLAMLFTYQVFVNYFAVAILFAWIVGELSGNDRQLICKERATLLTALTMGSMGVFMAVMWVLSRSGMVDTEARAHLITLDMVPERLLEMAGSLKRIYWQTEPTMPGWLKMLIWALLGLSVVLIARAYWANGHVGNRLQRSMRLIVPAILLVPLSLGVIVLFQGWWPVPRAVGHSAVIIGLVFLLGDWCAGGPNNRALRRIQGVGRGVILFGFVLISNQIFADQRKLNDWDLMTATRLVDRLEGSPDFRNIKYVHVSGGWWGYPAGLKTAGGNLNMSALWETWSKTELLIAASGYRFQGAKGEREVVGDSYCGTAPKWPEDGSTKVDGDLAIICLQK